MGLTKIKPLTMNVLNNLEQPILCTLNLYHDPDFNIDNNQFEAFETIDRNFIIYPNIFSFTKDQLTMLLEGNTCDSSSAYDEFDIQPTDFSVENLSYLSTK